ncbi:MAG TPA: DUF3570 domain-containing protein [Polyangia bacterium]
MKRAGIFLLALAGTLVPRAPVRADNEVTIRGAYYREPSTRVIQPVVEIAKDLPYGFDVRAHYLVDTITSASAAAGTGADNIFTEIRNELAIGVGKNWNRTRVTLSYKYSAESDYWSHAVWASVAQRLWADTATVGLFGGVSLDEVGFSNVPRRPNCVNPESLSCPLDSVYGGFAYTQVLSPVDVAQLNLDAANLWGFLANPYRQVPMGPEVLPTNRLRTAFSVRYAHYIPEAQSGIQVQFRYYHDFDPTSFSSDPWGLSASTIEARIYHQLTRELQIRLLFRQYFQQPPAFWCDVPSNPGCTATITTSSPYQSSDPALGPVRTEYPEVKLIWDADALRAIPFFRWFAAGTFEISYGYYFQNNAFGNAHVLQTGYTMPY